MSHKKVERIDPLTQALPCVGCDSHAHLDGEEFDADREEVLARARAAGVATIGNIVLNAGTPVVAGEQGICAGCGVATLSISYYDLGYKTGEMAAQILTGEADISQMAIAYAPAAKMYNPTMCEALNITVPDGYTAME